MRWLLLDQVKKVKKGEFAKTQSRIPASDEYSPEVLMIEMMAQTGGLLLGAETNYQSDVVFTKVESAEFGGTYDAGDVIDITVTSEALKPEGAWLDGVITRGAEIIAKSRFLLMNVGQLLSGQTGKSITFHDEFMNYFNVKNKLVIE